MTDATLGGGGSTRMPVTPLARFLASAAPPGIKAAVRDILADLGSQPRLDEAVLRREQPALLAHITGLTSAGLDLFRVLRGERPARTMHSRPNVGAGLRDKRRTLGRAPTTADYPAGHFAVVLAWAYWGSVEAWGAAAPGRAQLPKRHWRQHANQLAAVRDLLARYPGESVTHHALNRAGLHALAVTLTAPELEALVQEAGGSRNLHNRATASWTAEAIIAAYVELCEELGCPMSNHMLSKHGGVGCTVRERATRVFGSFRAFRLAVAVAHPWLAPARLPTASDGRLLDSWQEVAAYNALRRDLPPGTGIEAHVLLGSGLPGCSADLLVGGHVLVEVLMLPLADMATAGLSPTGKAYAGKWARKAAWYAGQATPLVVVEPADVAHAGRLAAKVAEVARLLGLPPPDGADSPGSPDGLGGPGGASMRAKGEWSFEYLCQAVAEVARAVGGFPTHAQLAAAGCGHAANLLKQHGMAARVAAAIDVPLRNVRGEWTPERVEHEVAAWVQVHGRYPVGRDLAGCEQGALASAAQRLFSGRQDELRAAVERRVGRALPRHMALPGSYATQAQVAVLLRPLCDRLGHFPLEAEMEADPGLPLGFYNVVSGRFGIAAMAACMGVPHQGRKRRSRAEVLALFRQVAAGAAPGAAVPRAAALAGLPGIGGPPAQLTTMAIRAALGSGGLAMLRRHFSGIAALRRALAGDSAFAAGPDRGSAAGQGGPGWVPRAAVLAPAQFGYRGPVSIGVES